METPRVMIAGGGIGGLALALTLDQIGIACTVYEQVRDLRPLGVGINLQPNAVRELDEMGLGADVLDSVGIPVREWALVGLNGNDIHAEPRGRDAGYGWAQYAVHRGRFHMLLRDRLVARAGPDALCLDARVTGYDQDRHGVTAIIEARDGRVTRRRGTLLIGADGIHSRVRAQMHPAQPPIHWGGAMMWRGTSRARPVRGGASFVGLGTHRQRMVIYPISPPGPDGLAEVNWIAEVTRAAPESRSEGWFREVSIDEVLPAFADWRYDWLDVPALLRGAGPIYENPMIDRDPVSTWQDGRVALLGDAAHAMYPTGSNGASQAIVDARVLGAACLRHGVTDGALQTYDAALCGPVSEVVLRNREAGPFGLLNRVDDLCGGEFDDIDAIIPAEDRAAFMAGYRRAAGFALEALNAAPPTIPAGARVRA